MLVLLCGCVEMVVFENEIYITLANGISKCHIEGDEHFFLPSTGIGFFFVVIVQIKLMDRPHVYTIESILTKLVA